MKDKQKLALSVQEIARRAGVNDATVRRWIQSGKLPAYSLPGKGHQSIMRVEAAVFEAFLRAYSTGVTRPMSDL